MGVMLRRVTLYLMLCMLLGVSACAVPRTNPVSPVVNIKAGKSVTVEPGETLYSFARRNNASMREIIDLNRLQAPYDMLAGKTLKLPATDSDLPSVELGPVATENENAYKQKHKGKPVTTYTQVVPEKITQSRAAELADDSAYAPAPAVKTVSELQNEADAQFSKPQIADPRPDKTALESALNLKPMHFDKKHKHLAEVIKSIPSVPVTVPEKTIPEKKVPRSAASKPAGPKAIAPKPRVITSRPDPNDEDSASAPKKVAAVIPPELKAPSPEKNPEPEKKKPELHSRIEKPAEPKNLIWPVQGSVISTYGPKSNGLKNDGINIAVPRGAPVVAADGGTVAYAGSDIPGYGNVVLVRHPSGLMTTYAHLDRMFVQQDIVVAKGDLLGTVGTSGGVDTPQLHFEIRRDKEALDPSKYLYR